MSHPLAISCPKVLALLSLGWLPVSAWCQNGDLAGAPDAANITASLSPATAAALQIQAESQFLKDYGQMQKDLAEARQQHAEAGKLEGDAAIQKVLNNIKLREIKEADHAKQVRKKIASRRVNYETTWERLKHHPELTSGEIATGRALNFLKNRLSGSFITYQPADKDSDATAKEVARLLHVKPSTVHALQVRQMVGRGEALIFRLDDGQPIQVDWWPPALRTPQLRMARTNFERVRNEVFATQSPDEFYRKIDNLLLAHARLEGEFLTQQPHSERIKTQQSIHDYLDGKAVLRSRLSEVRRLHRVGPHLAAASDLAFKGDDMTELLTHMVRNGLEFAPAKPGDETAYQQAFHMLRDLYVAIETDAIDAQAEKEKLAREAPKQVPANVPPEK